MKDKDRQEWSRHYDILQWTVIVIFTAGIGALLLSSIQKQNLTDWWAEAAGLFLSLVGLFYVARFRSFRNRLHKGIESDDLRNFLLHPGQTKCPGQWDVFVISFFLIDVFLIYRLATIVEMVGIAGWSQVFAITLILLMVVVTVLWNMGRSKSK